MTVGNGNKGVVHSNNIKYETDCKITTFSGHFQANLHFFVLRMHFFAKIIGRFKFRQ